MEKAMERAAAKVLGEYEGQLANMMTVIGLFYSFGTGENDELSSLREGFEFVGCGLTAGQRRMLAFLAGKVEGKLFKTLEHFFHYAKALFAARGAFAEENTAIATQLLRMTAREARDATQLKMMRGLDVASWTAIRLDVMRLGAAQQATGSASFARRLHATGDALLAEAKRSCSFWGIGYDAATARGHSVAKRRQLWGRNAHGKVLMEVRGAMRIMGGSA